MSGRRYRSTTTAMHTTTNASRIPMFVSSAASPIGRNPAITAAIIPRTQVIRVGTCVVGDVYPTHFGSSPSRLIA